MKEIDLDDGSTICDRIRKFARKFQWSVKYYGLDLTILGGMVKIASLVTLNAMPTDWYKRTTSCRFDKRFRVDTAGYIPVEELDINNHQKQQAVQYQPTGSVTFGPLLLELPIKHQDYVFVDYGSGKGRALILAAHFPFKGIIGVEVSNMLHQIAQDNIRRLLTVRVKCRDIVSVCEDATTFQLPNDPLVLYFFHPFKESVLMAVLDNIRQSLKRCWRHIIILYHHPDLDPQVKNLFEKTKFLGRARVRYEDPRWAIYKTVSQASWLL